MGLFHVKNCYKKEVAPEHAPEGVSELYVELQHVVDIGEKSNPQKVAIPQNGRLYKIILLSIRPPFEQQLQPRRHTIDNQISYLHDRDA